MKSKDDILCENLLREHGYRVTLGRVALLVFLKRTQKPLSVFDIQKRLGYKINKVTLYRALEEFTKSGIVVKVSLRNSVTYYEFVHAGHHHHHIVCERCGKIEDISLCNLAHLEKDVLKTTKEFTTITSHALEFFGLCKSCHQ